MILTNYHSHFNLDDGRGELNEYADSALERGLSIIGISPHAPLYFANEWTLTDSGLQEYLEMMPAFKSAYRGRLEIYTGLEIDFIPGKMGPSDSRWNSLGLEYRIGSVHSMEDPVSGAELSVDGPLEEMIQLLHNRFGNNIKRLVKEYFERQSDMLCKGGFDILGHCDLIKKRNTDDRFFNQDEDWYRKEAFNMLRTAAEKDVVVEVNTGGMSRGATTEAYPSPWILQKCYELNLPVTLSADAHSPDHIDFKFAESIELLKNTGYGEIYFFSGGKWQSQPIY